MIRSSLLLIILIACAAPPKRGPAEGDATAPSTAGCSVDKAERDACSARGRDCEILDHPQRSRCHNRGARCLDHRERRAKSVGCGCYCGDEYSRAYEQLNPRRSRRPICRERKNLATGKIETHCEKPSLPK